MHPGGVGVPTRTTALGTAPAQTHFPIPSGWFRVGFEDDFARESAAPVRYFGEELVLARTRSGRIQLLAAHCPHLGAHIGHGGCVEGERIQCPFHGWRFGMDGVCMEIPYARRIPPRATLRSYPTRVSDGIVWAWHDPNGAAPTWEPPGIPELADEDWSALIHHQWLIKTRNQEIAENTSDPAHFGVVHGFGASPEPEITFDGHRYRSVTRSRVARADGNVSSSRLEVTWHGLGTGIVRSTGDFQLLVVGTNTPVDETTIDARFSFSVCRAQGLAPDRGAGKAFIGEAIRQMEQDIPIWENKVFVHPPVLCDGDGPIVQFRNWATQFYADTPP